MVFFAPDHEAYERERGLLLRLPRPASLGRSSRPPDALAQYIRDGVFDLERVETFRARRPSTSPTARPTTRFVDEIVLPALRTSLA